MSVSALDNFTEPRRLLIFALHSNRGVVDGATLYQLKALRTLAERIVVVGEESLQPVVWEAVSTLCERIVTDGASAADSRAYRTALAGESDLDSFDEIIFSGNSWFGPFGDFGAVFERMKTSSAPVWQLIDTSETYKAGFPAEGFPPYVGPWTWVSVRQDVVNSKAWTDYWSIERSESEEEFITFLRNRNVDCASAFRQQKDPEERLWVLDPAQLVRENCPVLQRFFFAQYPPLLDRNAILLRPLISEIERRGYPVAELWQAVVKDTPPAALNAICGMLEILPEAAVGNSDPDPRVCVIAHVPEIESTAQVLARVSLIPTQFHLVLTTTDGTKARMLRQHLELFEDEWARHAEIRIVWVPRGRDMGALFMGCHDLLSSSNYDLIVRVHGRVSRKKTPNVDYYSRKYQLENLLSSPGFIRNLFNLFEKESGLGLVFPPPVHIGYSILGRGWGSYRGGAERLAKKLGIKVPIDVVSPLAPYGGMWVGRPEALKVLADFPWTVRDYNRSRQHQFGNLPRLQERMLPLAAAELGYHSRTVLNREHVEIGFAAMEFKSDEMFSTTHGWPVHQISLVRRAGWVGRGGLFAFARIYSKLVHPRFARLTEPFYLMARRAALSLAKIRRLVRNPPVEGPSHDHNK